MSFQISYVCIACQEGRMTSCLIRWWVEVSVLTVMVNKSLRSETSTRKRKKSKLHFVYAHKAWQPVLRTDLHLFLRSFRRGWLEFAMTGSRDC
eukprot:764547-Hanusia_phi.AAC.2